MEFCNKGMVRADSPPPVMVKDHKFTFYLDQLRGRGAGGSGQVGQKPTFWFFFNPPLKERNKNMNGILVKEKNMDIWLLCIPALWTESIKRFFIFNTSLLFICPLKQSGNGKVSHKNCPAKGTQILPVQVWEIYHRLRKNLIWGDSVTFTCERIF